MTLLKLCVWIMFILHLSAIAFADVITPLTTEKQSLLARLAMFRTHEIRKIRLVTFEIAEDSAGLLLAAHLIKVAEGGGDVEIIIDGLKHTLSAEFIKILTDKGIKVYEYNSFRPGQLSNVNHRLHDKMFIVNDDIALIGDKNWHMKYFSISRITNSMLGSEVVVHGNSVSQIAQHFEEIKNRKWVRLAASLKPNIFISKKKMNEIKEKMAELYEWSESLIEATHFAESFEVSSNKINFVGDHFEENKPLKKSSAMRAILQKIKTATKGTEVFIESAYVVPFPELERSLEAASKNQAEIKILTESVASSNQPWAAMATEAFKGELDKDNVALSVNAGVRTNHAKVTRVGDTITIGSVNMDPRSADINSESVLIIEDAAVAKHFRQIQETKWSKSQTVFTATTAHSCLMVFSKVSTLSLPERVLLKIFRGQL